ncbi:hypothetical protein GLOIN_2v1675397 [Rhizophagus irregularis DAOM 181602=DAOM 197198]|uniref:Uncharacterized protein n=1 Tax=Rhizophagus irregularis (strain DAOM 181602 / DAOM 197198 / MUCL 43194) TaxID=747089 RepID=A0A2P4PGF0_RHIID|nr:hypothetical protein GLOIN_2v1675397 [Rhizophagus irregularis DAOM 181602=DAOM 197198]POG64466.1 hypothetical protein GLOIN_2v1675397 [Rhizophagus irregularis DAOM 181602=DAOM 197198]|eukprot:XP_025171332.1 hypothetical protein GLOIN_2v1675397 [Rhizophagus irregularis DAOM 181602=DAOM 197198]
MSKIFLAVSVLLRTIPLFAFSGSLSLTSLLIVKLCMRCLRCGGLLCKSIANRSDKAFPNRKQKRTKSLLVRSPFFSASSIS